MSKLYAFVMIAVRMDSETTVEATVVDDKRPQFGARYLTEDKDVYKHNAWDDVEWDSDQEKVRIKTLKKVDFPNLQ